MLLADWVESWGAYVGLLVGLCSLVAFTYAFTKFIMRQFRVVLREEVAPIVAEFIKPITDEQTLVRQELVAHMVTEQSLLAVQTEKIDLQTEAMERHFSDDTEFQEQTTQRFAEQQLATVEAREGRSDLMDAIHDLSDVITRPPTLPSPGSAD